MLHACPEQTKSHHKPCMSHPGSELLPKYLRPILQVIEAFLRQRRRCLLLGLGAAAGR